MDLPHTHLRLTGWIQRYLPAEVLATAVVAVTALAPPVHASAVVMAAAGSCGETVAFYSVLLARDLHRRGDVTALPAAVGALLVEFGPAEALDTLLRPVLLYAALCLVSDVTAGLLAGKLVADLLFYGAAIASTSLRAHVSRAAVAGGLFRLLGGVQHRSTAVHVTTTRVVRPMYMRAWRWMHQPERARA